MTDYTPQAVRLKLVAWCGQVSEWSNLDVFSQTFCGQIKGAD